MTHVNRVPTASEPPAHEAHLIPLTEVLGRVCVAPGEKQRFLEICKTGVHLMGGPGTGKSRLLGRDFAWLAVLFPMPLLVVDGVGGTLDNFFDVLARLPCEWRRLLVQRIRYLDVGATDSIVPTQLYYRRSGHDTLFEIANRFPAILQRQDPDLQSAPILGWNSLHECAVHAGMIAAALHRQIDFVIELVSHPKLYKEELRQALVIDPQLQAAVAYFRELMDEGKQTLREKRTGSLLTKLLPFTADPTNLARYAASRPGLDWEEVERKRLLVLIDLRHVQDPDQQQFAYLWYVKQFTDYIRLRGMKGRGHEFLVILDEISQMLRFRTRDGKSLLEDDINELTTVIGRNYGVNVVIAHQNLMQVSEGVQHALMQMGTQVIGRLPNPKDARMVAEQLLTYDPYLLKKLEPIWMNVSTGFRGLSVPTIVDYRKVEFTLDEQIRMLQDKLKNLDRFQFLAQRAKGEGRNATTTALLRLDAFDPGEYPVEEEIAPMRALFRQACGVPIAELLQELEQRKPPTQVPPVQKWDKKKTPPSNGKLEGHPAHDGRHSLPVGTTTPTPATPNDHLSPTPSEDDHVWQ